MEQETGNSWEGKAIVIAVIVTAITVFYFWISAQYPYYFMWDQDYVLTLDSVLIQSGLLPDHIHHPGFGLNFLWFFTQKIAHSLNVLSILSLEDLRGSLNPFAAMAEQVAFMRLHTPILLAAMVISLWIALTRLFSPPFWLSIGILLFLGTQNSLIYHASMIRTEAYSLFYWSLAIAFSVCALKGGKIKWVWFFMAGALLGLAFLTKVQCFFYLLGFVLFFLLAGMITPSNTLNKETFSSIKNRWLDIAMAGTGLGLFIALIAVASFVPLPSGFATWTKNYYLSPIAIVFIAAFFLLTLFVWMAKKEGGQIFHHAGNYKGLILLSWGFLGSFLLHLLLFKNLTTGFQYLIYDFKMLFLRMSFHESHSLNAYARHLMEMVSFNPIDYVLHLILFLFVILFRNHVFDSRRASRIFISLLGIFWALFYVNLLLGTRGLLRDLLWIEVLLVFSTCFFLLIFYKYGAAKPVYRVVFCLAVLAVAIFSNVLGSKEMVARIDADYNLYGWDSRYWFRGIFSRNHPLYSDIMQKRYGEISNISLVKKHAARASQTRRLVSYVFKNQSLSFQNIGIVEPGFWVWRSNLSYRFSTVPLNLRGAILVDTLGVPLRNHIFFQGSHVSQHSNVLDKIDRSRTANAISILPRNDLDIYLFKPLDDGIPDKRGTSQITIRKGEHEYVYVGRKIQEARLELDDLGNRYFFVIKEKY
jgi:hypothetical protein